MSISGASVIKESAHKIAFLKDQVVEMMRMRIRPHLLLAYRGYKEVDPSKNKTSESSYSQAMSKVETLTKKMCIMESSVSRGNVDLENLTNFPQVVMPPKFKSLEFVKYDGTRDPYAHLRIFCRKMAPYGHNSPLLCQIFINSFTGPVATWYVRLEKTSS